MAKKGKIYPFQFASAYGVFQAVYSNARRIGEYIHKKIHREPFQQEHENCNARRREFSSRIRLLFLVVAFPIVIISLMLTMLALMQNGPHPSKSDSVMEKFKHFVKDNNSFVLFVAACSAMINTTAIFGAIFNWPTVLFVYVVITGIVGTIVGIVGLFGIVVTCLFINHANKSDHTIAITSLIVIIFVLIFYVLTIIGLKLMTIVRRSTHDSDSKRYQVFKDSSINRQIKRPSYKSIDTITSLFTSNENDEQELNQVYVDKSMLNSEPIPPYKTSFSSRCKMSTQQIV